MSAAASPRNWLDIVKLLLPILGQILGLIGTKPGTAGAKAIRGDLALKLRDLADKVETLG